MIFFNRHIGGSHFGKTARKSTITSTKTQKKYSIKGGHQTNECIRSLKRGHDQLLVEKHSLHNSIRSHHNSGSFMHNGHEITKMMNTNSPEKSPKVKNNIPKIVNDEINLSQNHKAMFDQKQISCYEMVNKSIDKEYDVTPNKMSFNGKAGVRGYCEVETGEVFSFFLFY